MPCASSADTCRTFSVVARSSIIFSRRAIRSSSDRILSNCAASIRADVSVDIFDGPIGVGLRYGISSSRDSRIVVFPTPIVLCQQLGEIAERFQFYSSAIITRSIYLLRLILCDQNNMCGSCIALGIVGVLMLLAYIGSSETMSGYSSKAFNAAMRGGSAISGMATGRRPVNPYQSMYAS